MPNNLAKPNAIQSINDNVAVVRSAINHLNDRIRRFQDYLSILPGRTEAACYFPEFRDETGNKKCIGLKLHREGKAWILSWSLEDMDDPFSTAEWKPLLDAPIRHKLLCVSGFPELLGAIATAHHILVNQITSTVEAYDKFEATLPKTGGK